MDDLEKKMFLQFDDDMPAQRANALEMLREHMKKKTPARFFRDFVADIEAAVPPARVAALETELANFKAANAQAKQANDALTQEAARLRREVASWKAAAAIRVNWRKLAAGVAAVALLGGAYYWWGPGAAAAEESARVNAAYRSALEKIAWREGQSDPVVGNIAGKPYWIVVRGETETGHVDNQGRPVVLQCSHVFGAPAVADWSGAYRPPNFSNSPGWFGWPERATLCKVAAKQLTDGALPPRFQLLSWSADDIPDPATPEPDAAAALERAKAAQLAMRQLSSPTRRARPSDDMPPDYTHGDRLAMDRLIEGAK